jgi:hypothetical protein
MNPSFHMCRVDVGGRTCLHVCILTKDLGAIHTALRSIASSDHSVLIPNPKF